MRIRGNTRAPGAFRASYEVAFHLRAADKSGSEGEVEPSNWMPACAVVMRMFAVSERFVLWWLISGFFVWLALREIYQAHVSRPGYGLSGAQVSITYVCAMLFIAGLFAYTPIRYARFERHLTKKAQILSGSPQATVHCNTLFDTFFDSEVFSAGHANMETGEIALQHPWCGRLMDYLSKPKGASLEEIDSLHILVHESMHIRGEHNEARADCQAIQRDYQASKLLGIPDDVAKANSRVYYLGEYQKRATQGSFSSQYFSDQCAPGKALDEKLPDSTWN